MSSSVGFLAYLMREPVPAEVLDLQIDHAERHLRSINTSPLIRTQVGDSGSGFVAWTSENPVVSWKHFIRRGDSGIGWIHIPSVAGGPDSGVDEWDLAQSLFTDKILPEDIGSPFAAVRWDNGQLELLNDMLGLVRVFHFTFESGDIWTTRPGLAHVFMGEIPVKNQLAWSGMATLGWASSGSTQLGDGRQLAAGTRVRGGFSGPARYLDVKNHFGEWVEKVRGQVEPSPEINVQDMIQYMSIAKRWPRQAVADLSGGKDSRVVSAIGIKSGAVTTVRTIETDHGEVETAKLLMELIDDDVEHRIDARKDPARPGGSFLERIGSQHLAWEGRFLATTAYNGPEFQGFKERLAPTFNGLGGEVMAGGNLLGAWHDRLINAPGPAARDKLSGMVNVALGVSGDAKESVVSDISGYISRADSFGLPGAASVMDLFYHLDKMPNWSITYATPAVITPLFAPSMLVYALLRLGHPLAAGESHRRLLREAMPAWADVPFYKPTAKKRATPFIWESEDWPEVLRYVCDRVDSLATFDPSALQPVLDKISEKEATKREEIVVQRFIWESTFDDYIDQIANEARKTAAAIRQLSGNLRLK